MNEIDIRIEGLPARKPGMPARKPGTPARKLGMPAPPWLDACRDFAGAVLGELGIGDWEVSILLCTDEFIRELNKRYRGRAEPTDVLSFPQQPEAGSPPGQSSPARIQVAGDIVISMDSLARNAEREGESRETELKRLLIHGMLHLQGLDHPEEGDSDMMRAQARLLERLREKRIEL